MKTSVLCLIAAALTVSATPASPRNDAGCYYLYETLFKNEYLGIGMPG